MKVVASTEEYTIYLRRDGRHAIKSSSKQAINGDDKVRLLLEHGLIEVLAPKGTLDTFKDLLGTPPLFWADCAVENLVAQPAQPLLHLMPLAESCAKDVCLLVGQQRWHYQRKQRTRHEARGLPLLGRHAQLPGGHRLNGGADCGLA